jgi:hypothetical protein
MRLATATRYRGCRLSSSAHALATLARVSRATGWQPTASATIDGVHTDDLHRLAAEVADQLPLAGAPLATTESL